MSVDNGLSVLLFTGQQTSTIRQTGNTHTYIWLSHPLRVVACEEFLPFMTQFLSWLHDRP